MKYRLLEIAATLVFVSVSLFRFVDADEGYYLYSALLVAHGNIPYRDFFFPQAPLLPYLLSPATIFGSASWYVSRLFTAIACSVLIIFISRMIRRRFGDLAGMICLVLFASSGHLLMWGTVIKTYTWSLLLLNVALYGVMTLRARYVAIAAFVMAICAGVRAPMIVCAFPLALIPLWLPDRAVTRRQRLMSCLLFCGVFGAFCALVFLPFYLIAPDSFVFGNVGYHAHRDPSGMLGDWRQKLYTLASIFGVRGCERDLGIQMFLLALACGPAAVLRSSRSLLLPLAATGLTLFLVHILPTPTYEQYFVTVIPFMIPIAAIVLARAACAAPAVRVAAVIALAAYCLCGASAARRACWTGSHIMGVWGNPEEWRLSAVRQMTTIATQAAKDHDVTVYSTWSGYLVGMDARVAPGSENHFAQFIAPYLSASQRAKYKTPTIEDLFCASTTSMLVLKGIWIDKPSLRAIDSLIDSRMIYRHGDQEILLYYSANQRVEATRLRRAPHP